MSDEDAGPLLKEATFKEILQEVSERTDDLFLAVYVPPPPSPRHLEVLIPTVVVEGMGLHAALGRIISARFDSGLEMEDSDGP